MKTMICLAVFAVTMSVAYAEIGVYCSTAADCGDTPANWDCTTASGCANGTCACSTGKAGAACDKIAVGQTCTVATDTPNCHDTSTCEGVDDTATEGKCTPPCAVEGTTYNWDVMSCMADGYVKIDAVCTTDAQCAGGRAASGAVPTCDDDDEDATTPMKCKCTDVDYQADSNMINCEKLAYDAECTGDEKCTSNVCTEGKCACPTGQERYLSTCVATGGLRDLDNGEVCMLDLTKTCDADLACCPVVDSDPVSYVCMAEEEEGGNNTSGASAVSAVLFTIASAIMALLF